MKICMIAEGSYPYVTGGVSSWLQSFITAMPEHEFVVYAIGAEEKTRGAFKYKLPKNLSQVHEVFLDTYTHTASKPGGKIHLTEAEKEALTSVLVGGDTDWMVIRQLLTNQKIKSVPSLIYSKAFFDIAQEICSEKYRDAPFTELFWTIRAMMLPLFTILKEPIPEADIYHSVSTGYAGVVGSVAKWQFQKPFVLTEHGIYTREREEEIIKADWAKGYFKDLWIQHFYHLSQFAYASANQVVSLFNKNKEIQVEIGCPEQKIAIIPNGVNLDMYTNLEDLKSGSEDAFRIGAVVRVVPIKDIKTMLTSFSIAKKRLPKAKLFVFGSYDEDFEYYQECLHFVQSLGVSDVTFAGEVNVQAELPKLDLLLLSSISEGQPLAVLEAMASKVPVVSTDVGSCRELLEGLDDGIGPAGAIVPVMNPARMGQKIIQLCKNPGLRKQMGENGRERVCAFYQRTMFIREYQKMYADLGNCLYSSECSRD